MAHFAWRETNHTPVTKADLTSYGSGPVQTYKLSAEELEQYRALKPKPEYSRVETFAKQTFKPQRPTKGGWR